MDLRIMIEPQQGASFEQQLAVARATERGGFDAFFRSDHFLAFGDADGSPGPTDSWVTLGALARETSGIRLGTMVSSITFRWPGLLAVMVAQVDQMSGGRVELGLGTGWFDDEHHAYGVPFPPLKERFERLEEQLQIVTGLWTTPVGERYSFDGRHYTVANSPGLPKPAQQPRPPVIIGGAGPSRTPALAARFADEFNVPFHGLDDGRKQLGRVREACETAGRDPDELTYSVCQAICVGVDEAQVERRAAKIGRPVQYVGVAGTPAQVVEQLGEWEAAGTSRAYLQVLDLDDLEQIDLLAAEVLPHV